MEPRDAEHWFAMINDAEVRRYLPQGPLPTLDDFERILERRHAMERDRGHAMWAVEPKESGIYVGQCGVQPIPDTSEVELAYHFSRAVWGKGYASEAAAAVLRYIFETAGLDRVIAIVIPENIASWRVLEKVGMCYEGIAEYHGLTGLKKYYAEREWWIAGAGRSAAVEV